MRSETMTDEPCKHDGLPYLSASSDAQRRLRKGERQVWCGRCGLWRWPHEVGEGHRASTYTRREFAALEKRCRISALAAVKGEGK